MKFIRLKISLIPSNPLFHHSFISVPHCIDYVKTGMFHPARRKIYEEEFSHLISYISGMNYQQRNRVRRRRTDISFRYRFKKNFPILQLYQCSNKKTRNQHLIPGFEEKFGGVLLSHPASRAVPSAVKSLTTVFGMGTGVASSLLPPKNESLYLVFGVLCFVFGFKHAGAILVRLCPLFCGQAARPISTSKLNALPHLHTWPINLVIFEGSSVSPVARGKGYLILGWASRLDAFSGYPYRT